MRSRWNCERAWGVKILVRKVMKRSSSSGVEEGEKLGIAGGRCQFDPDKWNKYILFACCGVFEKDLEVGGLMAFV
jgi:hypothetical protein